MKMIPLEGERKIKNALDMPEEEELLKDDTPEGQARYWEAKAKHYLTIIGKASAGIEAMNNRLLRMQNRGEKEGSKKALIVGRTKQDLYECYDVGSESLHLPAPSTLLYDESSIRNFDGDIITLHTPKPWSDYIISMELDERETEYADPKDPRFIIGIDGYSQLFGGYTGELPNSGIYSIFWAMEEGYDEVYTLGLDLINWWVNIEEGPHHHFGRSENPYELDWSALEKTVRNWPPEHGGYVKGVGRVPTHYQQALVIAKIAYKYPTQRIFKATDISLLPCETKSPPGLVKLS